MLTNTQMQMMIDSAAKAYTYGASNPAPTGTTFVRSIDDPKTGAHAQIYRINVIKRVSIELFLHVHKLPHASQFFFGFSSPLINPIGRFFCGSGGVINSRMASNTCLS